MFLWLLKHVVQNVLRKCEWQSLAYCLIKLNSFSLFLLTCCQKTLNKCEVTKSLEFYIIILKSFSVYIIPPLNESYFLHLSWHQKWIPGYTDFWLIYKHKTGAMPVWNISCWGIYRNCMWVDFMPWNSIRNTAKPQRRQF